jgi:hypothetical protein
VTDRVSIAEAMESPRSQVLAAAESSQVSDLVFRVREIEVEFQVALTVRKSAPASVSLWRVLTFGAGVDASRGDTHRVRLVLEPRRTGAAATEDSSVDISDSG